jgi:putative SOS response-associated peptidase YedK
MGGGMCGRFVLYSGPGILQSSFPIDASTVDEIAPDYNIAPSREVLVIVRRAGRNVLEAHVWGLVPFWARDKTIGGRMINARAETAAVKPAFRNAFKHRRCLIPADGFYEWQGEKGRKQPMFLALPDRRPFAFAGLWDTWDDRGREPLPYRSCAILTTEASESVRPIHHRMPVILQPEAYEAWLDPENRNVDRLQELLHASAVGELEAVAVSTRVNATRNNDPANIAPLSPS